MHPTAELNTEDFDPANRSLAEALRISFAVLKLVVIALLIVFVVVGGYRNIEKSQVGIRLRFGEPDGRWITRAGERVFEIDLLEPGPHFALPEPIDRIIIVPTLTQTTPIAPIRDQVQDPVTGERTEVVDPAFWFEDTNPELPLTDALKQPSPGGLQPGRDGMLITADANIVHALWTVSWQVDRPGQFAVSLGGADVRQSLRRGQEVVRNASMQAIIHVVAQTTVEQFLAFNVNRVAIMEQTQGYLDRMRAGIKITNVSIENPTAPLAVRPSFEAVSKAISQARQAREEARREREQKLRTLAGDAYEALLLTWEYFDRATRADDAAALARARTVFEALLAGQTAAEALEPLAGGQGIDPQRLALARIDQPISGEVARLLQEARSDAEQIKTRLAADAQAFQSYYQRYTRNGQVDEQLRAIIIRQLWHQTVAEVFTKARETFWTPSDTGQLYLELGRNPALQQQRQREATEQRRAAGRNGG